MIEQLAALREEREKQAEKALQRTAARRTRNHRARVAVALVLIVLAYLIGWQAGFLSGRYPDPPRAAHH